MKTWNIGIVGAQGQIGKALIEVVETSSLPIAQLDPIGYSTDGEAIRFQGKNRTVLSIEEIDDWSVYHLVFLTTSRAVSEQYARKIADTGCIVIDASGAFTSDYSIPLVLPRVNASALTEYRNENIVSLPHPILIQLLNCLSALTHFEYIQQINVTNLISASLFGKKGVDELASQSARLLNGLPVEKTIFEQQLAFNLLPDFQHDLLNNNELITQFQRITLQDQIGLNIENIVLPVFYGLTQTVSFLNTAGVSVNALDTSRFSEAGITFNASKKAITPLDLTSQEDEKDYKIHLIKLRENELQPDYIQYVSVSDNVNTLGAKTLCELAEQILTHY